jgi:hypothetical protein
VVSAVWPSASSLAIVPRHRERGRALVPLAVSALVLVVLAGVATAETVRDPGDGYQGDNVVEHFARPAADAVSGHGLVLVTSPPTELTNAAWALETSAIETGLQTELQRRGVDVTTDNDREFLVGPDHVIGDRRADVRLVVTADTSVEPVIDPETTLASFDYLTPEERSEYQALDRKGGTVPPTPLVGTDLYRWGDLRSRAVVYTLTMVPGDG